MVTVLEGHQKFMTKLISPPKIFYRVFNIYFNGAGVKEAAMYIRNTFSTSMMDSKKIVLMFFNEYEEDRIKEMLENIMEYSPEYTI